MSRVIVVLCTAIQGLPITGTPPRAESDREGSTTTRRTLGSSSAHPSKAATEIGTKILGAVATDVHDEPAIIAHAVDL
jgi:hypothetical protein